VVADDGRGEPRAVARVVRGEVPGTGGGYHRGLADVAARVKELGGALSVERSELNGVQIEVRLPLGVVARHDAHAERTGPHG